MRISGIQLTIPLGGAGHTRRAAGAGCMILFSLPFAGIGVFTTVAGVRKLLTDDWKDGAFLTAFGLVFACAGFGIMAATIYGSGLAKRKDARKTAHPDEPWLWNAEWAGGRIRGEGKGTMVSAWVFAGIWNAISAPLLVMVLREVREKNNTLALLGLAFPVIGAALAVWAIKATVRWRKYGRSTFEMASVPGVIGGQLGGAVLTNVNIRPEHGFSVTLTCINRVHTGSGDTSSTSEHIRWQEKRTAAREILAADPTRSAIPVQFTIPYDAEPTDDTNPNDRILWRLEVGAEVPGVDYHAQFEVPVFKTPDSSADVIAGAGPGAIADYLADAHATGAAPSRIAVVPQTDGGADIVFPAARNPGAAVAVTLFALAWGAVVGGMIYFGAPVFLAVMFAFVELIIAGIVLWLWFGVTRVRINRDGLTIRNSILGLGGTNTVVVVENITVDIGMQFGQTPYYDIMVVKSDEKKIRAGGSIRDKREAEALAAAMRAALDA